ncbi:MAG: heme lyase CcmF/NrfE family subunit, partial [Pseudomonadota bacterium]|nr:heme lyase CcmF/NrfE family subunit [Pseudomonadota bacterium]
PWTLLAWSFLTLGITLGSAWAYRVLGWGGWWFWDPVENASLMPWLAGTALLHSLAVAAKRNTFKAWTVLLAICAFSLSLIGTFLVRSGVLVSVHAFAVDSARGTFILEFLTFVIGGSLLLYAWRGQSVRSSAQFALASRETLILTNNVLLLTMMLTVLLGTLYPLVIDALGLGKLSVGPPYFNAVLMPIALPLIFLMGVAPLFQWGQQSVTVIWQRLRWTLLFSLLTAILVPWLISGEWHWQVTICVALALWLVIATWQSWWLRAASGQSLRRRFTLRHLGMTLAHAGIAITTIGIVISTLFGVQREVRMQVGESIQVAAYDFKLLSLQSYQGPNFQAQQATVSVTQHGKAVTILNPDIRYYPVQKNAQPHAAISATLMRDVYVVLGQPLANNSWSMRFYVKPLVRWIWAGGIMMLLGGLCAAIGLRSKKISTMEEPA